MAETELPGDGGSGASRSASGRREGGAAISVSAVSASPKSAAHAWTRGVPTSETAARKAGTHDARCSHKSAALAWAIPARAVNQASSVPAGTAVDIAGLAGGAGKQIAAITGLLSIVGGYVGNQFKLVALPEVASYSLVGFVTEAGLKLPVSGSVAIADGFDGSAAIKRGRSEPGSLTAKSHYIDYMSGLARINGFFVTGRIDVLKDDRVLTERTIIGR